MRKLFIMPFALAMLLASCKAPTTHTASRQWDSPPPVRVDAALSKALSYLEEHKQNFEHGYDLTARRGAGYWSFSFYLLPSSPDFEIHVTVYDYGLVKGFPLSPPREDQTLARPPKPLHSTPR
jgi:hypothetical protein